MSCKHNIKHQINTYSIEYRAIQTEKPSTGKYKVEALPVLTKVEVELISTDNLYAIYVSALVISLSHPFIN